QPQRVLRTTRERRGERESAAEVAADLVHAAIAQPELREGCQRPHRQVPDEVHAAAATMLHRRAVRQRVDEIRESRRVVPRADRELPPVGTRPSTADPEAPLSGHATVSGRPSSATSPTSRAPSPDAKIRIPSPGRSTGTPSRTAPRHTTL